MTSMTSCIVGKKIRAMGPGPLELFPFVVHAIKLCIVGKKIRARSLRVISLCCSGYTDGHGIYLCQRYLMNYFT